MKKISVIIFSLLLLSACGKKPTASFTWLPQNPKVGEEV
jgi:uncharacterized lipoprotein YmbA